MKPYCESVALKLLPTLRALVAKELMENYGMTQQQAASKLGITQSAISQYIRKLRGSQLQEIEKNKKVYKKIEVFASRVASNDIKGQIETLDCFCSICRIVRKEGIV